jgi:hypothetical protein
MEDLIMLLRSAVAAVALSLAAPAPAAADVVTTWNATALTCISTGRPGPTGLVDLALVHGAMHDAVQAIQGRFESYRYRTTVYRGIGNPQAAAAAAAYHTLVGLYGPNQACLANVVAPAIQYANDPGLAPGLAAAQAFLQIQRPPTTLPIDPFIGGTAPGEWRPTPGFTAAQNAYMSVAEPFTLLSNRQFRPEPPPPLKSLRYYRDYEEVRKVGSLNSSVRTAAQTDLARFWSNPPSALYSGVRAVADANLSNVGDSARLLALVSFAAADSQFAVYESKMFYNFWRPYTAIREGDHDTNPRTAGDPTWLPFLTTPPYSDYSSGANCLAGAVTKVIELFFGRDTVEFRSTSPTMGLTVNPRVYARLSDVRRDMVDVRIYQGIHFRFADDAGRQQGERIGHWVAMGFLRPLRGR